MAAVEYVSLDVHAKFGGYTSRAHFVMDDERRRIHRLQRDKTLKGAAAIWRSRNEGAAQNYNAVN